MHASNTVDMPGARESLKRRRPSTKLKSHNNKSARTKKKKRKAKTRRRKMRKIDDGKAGRPQNKLAAEAVAPSSWSSDCK